MHPLTQSLLTGLNVVAILALFAPAAPGQGITVDLGKTETGRYVNLVGNTPGSDGEITGNIFIASEYAARSKGTSMYFDVNDGYFYQLGAGKFVIVNVEYFDAPGVQIKLVYDARSAHSGKEHGQTIATTGSNTWKARSFTIIDAYFGNGLANGADFKLAAAANTMKINAVSVVPFEAYMNYGALRDSINMEVREEQGGDSKTEIVTLEGEECSDVCHDDEPGVLLAGVALVGIDRQDHRHLHHHAVLAILGQALVMIEAAALADGGGVLCIG